MRALPPAHVPRPRLIQALAAAPVGLVEAPGGFGKSVLAAELAAYLDVPELEAELVGTVSTPSLLVAALRRGAVRAGLSDLATELGSVVDDDPAKAAASLADVLAGTPGALLLVVDEAELLEGPAIEVLGAIARRPPGRSRVLVLGRSLPPRVVALAGHGAVRLDAAQLTFDRREVAALLQTALGEEAGAVEEAAVFAAGQGWPALTALAAARLAREPAATRAHLDGARRTLAVLVDDALAGLDAEGRRVAAQLAHLPLLSPALVDAVAGDGAFDQLVADGLPLAPRGDGWHELPGRVREELAGRGALDGEVARRAGAVYAASGELSAAVGLLARAGEHEAIAGLVASQPLAALTEVGLPVLLATLATVPDEVLRASPRALLQAARAADLARSPARGDLLDRALRVGGADPATARELDAERAIDAYSRRDYDAIETLAAGVLREAAPGEVLARGRALVARAVLASEQEDPAGASALAEAAALFETAGERRWRSEALAMLAFRFQFHEGQLETAARTMNEALAGMPGASLDRASWQCFRAEIATYAGDLGEADAALREAEATARALGARRSLAYAAWVGALLATVRRDPAIAVQRFLLAEQQGGYEPGSGLLLMCDAACALARLGDEEAARPYLERAERDAEALGFEVVALLPRGIFESRFGDPARAEEALAAYAASEERQMAPRDEWRILLERAWAARRRGDGPQAVTLAARAFEAARARGLEDLPALHEPDLLAELAPLASAAGSDAARAATDRDPSLAVITLGRFEVTGDGRPLDLQPGHTSTLVKLLAVARGPVPWEQAVEVLWPSSDAETGRRRLRNVLNRIRTSCGELVVRHDETLALDPAVEVDVRLFAREAGAALAANPERRGALARTALARYGGELLPGDRYEAWAAVPREEVRHGVLDLLDTLAEDARERGELDEAIRLLEQAIRIEPADEARYLVSAELLLMQGRRGSARDLVERARTMREDFGLPRSPRLERLVEATRAGALRAG